MLAVAWHKSISFYSINGPESVEFKSVCHFTSEIRYLGWMEPGTMIGIFKSGDLWLSSFAELTASSKVSLSSPEIPASREICGQGYLNLGKPLLHNSVRAVNRSLYMLCPA